MDGSNDVLIGKQSSNKPANQPGEAKKHHRSPPCVADVFHKLSSQLGHSCPNRRPWEKMRWRRREDSGRGRRGGQRGGWQASQRSDGLRRRGVWELSGKACAKCSGTKYHLTARPPEGEQRACMCKCLCACVCVYCIALCLQVCVFLKLESYRDSWEGRVSFLI